MGEFVTVAAASDIPPGEMTIVESRRRVFSTMEGRPQREQRNCTFGCEPTSVSLSTCCVPQ